MRQPRRVSRHLARQPFGTRRAARCPSLRTRQGPLPVPHDTSRHDLVPATPVCPAGALSPAPRRPPWPSWYAPLRALPRIRRTVPLRCVDRLCCCVAARHWRSFSMLLSTRRALRPGNVASGDQCVRGTLAPRHHAGTNNLLSKALGAAGRKADLAPRHYRILPTGDMPRKGDFGRFRPPAGSDGDLRLRPPARRTPPQRTSSSRCRGARPCRTGRHSPPAGRSSRSRRPSAAPASRCRDRPPAPP